MINRDMARILAVFRLPLSLTSVFSLPEVLVVNVVSVGLGCAKRLPIILLTQRLCSVLYVSF